MIVGLAALVGGCASVKVADFDSIQEYTLKNKAGMEVRFTNYGAIITSIKTADRDGNMADITFGYNDVSGYMNAVAKPYFGAVVGRYGNRIAKGKFTVDGQDYTLAINNGENHLHGGLLGFDKVVWAAEPVRADAAVGVRLSYLSPDGEEGYPGNLSCVVTYWITEANELKITYEASTDKATPVNLTHHSYFNLAGQGRSDILGHELKLEADLYTPVDAGLIPTGELLTVQGTPFDFTSPYAIGARIAQVPGGYDHNFVLNKEGMEGLMTLAATVYEPTTGRFMEVFTEEPGVQFYCGNFLDGRLKGKSGKIYVHRGGFCLETQHYPDSPNQPNFPSTILRPGEDYKTRTVYRFSVR